MSRRRNRNVGPRRANPERGCAPSDPSPRCRLTGAQSRMCGREDRRPLCPSVLDVRIHSRAADLRQNWRFFQAMRLLCPIRCKDEGKLCSYRVLRHIISIGQGSSSAMIKDVGSFLETTAKMATDAVILRFPDLSQEWFDKQNSPTFDDLMARRVCAVGRRSVRGWTKRPVVKRRQQARIKIGSFVDLSHARRVSRTISSNYRSYALSARRRVGTDAYVVLSTIRALGDKWECRSMWADEPGGSRSRDTCYNFLSSHLVYCRAPTTKLR
jgi:hypothetical protein